MKYIEFASLLKRYRVQSGKTMQQIASAIENDRTHLSKLETGNQRPSQSVIASLVSYFNLSPSLAYDFYKAAGFEYHRERVVFQENKSGEVIGVNGSKSATENDLKNQLQIQVSPDMQVLYTDSILVTSNNFGLVLDFAQTLGSTNQQKVVGRVGMSHEHGRALLKVLKEKLELKVNEDSIKH